MATKPALGLSITDATLEALELKAVTGGFQIGSYAWLKLPEGIVKDGKVVQVKELGKAVRQLMASGKPRSMKGPVVLGLPQGHVFLKVFSIPEFEGKDLDEAINWHVGSLAPILPQDAYTAYEVTGKGAKEEVKVLLAAVSKPIIDGYLEALQLVGVEVLAIEPLALAKARLVDPKRLAGKSAISVHLYGGMLSVSVLVGGKLWFSQEVVVGQGNEEMVKSKVAEVMSYFNEKKDNDVAGVSEIIFCGDRGGLEVLGRSLVGFNIPVTRAEAGIVLKPSRAVGEVTTASFAPVLGLAMRGRLKQKGLLNLLPKWPEERSELIGLKRGFSQAIGLGLLIVWSVALALGGGWWWLMQQQRLLEMEQVNLQARFAKEKEAEVLSWGNQFNRAIKVVGLLEESRVLFSQVLAELAVVTPKGVRISSFSYQPIDKRWAISGIAGTRDEVLVLDRELKNSVNFSDAKLYFSSLDSDEGVAFRFSGGKDVK